MMASSGAVLRVPGCVNTKFDVMYFIGPDTQPVSPGQAPVRLIDAELGVFKEAAVGFDRVKVRARVPEYLAADSRGTSTVFTEVSPFAQLSTPLVLV
jgi:hypothetical protein